MMLKWLLLRLAVLKNIVVLGILLVVATLEELLKVDFPLVIQLSFTL
jgi:hypothetical protein